MLDNHVFVFPIVLLIYIPVSFIVTYGIAVAYGHVDPGFPYISDTGTLSPESCAFGQLLNIGALLCSIVIYTRYKQIEKFYRDKSSRTKLLRLNKGCFILGLSACLGLSIVGNFQETNVEIVHTIGAFLAFGFGGTYGYIQAAMSFRMMEVPGSDLKILVFRVVLCVGDFISLVLFLVFARKASSEVKPSTNHLKWTRDEPGYTEHLVSSTAEWVAGILTVIFLATFFGEFRKFKLQAPEVIFFENQNNNSNKSYASNVIIPAE
ncbi:hypothetical protein CHS0354_040791 [Potamilus streckersoni]|uniref:CWH43-like N-terminal domain-containing protein n=1 Tax=Potamilus streckersoni TaxID=2493646 RepID=A0AAE0SLP9_9BIVA|nr:hypothetical protein CHS0354_040791 [Potamilus streckersoni]